MATDRQIKQALLALGWSQERLGEAAGMNQTEVSRTIAWMSSSYKDKAAVIERVMIDAGIEFDPDGLNVRIGKKV